VAGSPPGHVDPISLCLACPPTCDSRQGPGRTSDSAYSPVHPLWPDIGRIPPFVRYCSVYNASRGRLREVSRRTAETGFRVYFRFPWPGRRGLGRSYRSIGDTAQAGPLVETHCPKTKPASPSADGIRHALALLDVMLPILGSSAYDTPAQHLMWKGWDPLISTTTATHALWPVLLKPNILSGIRGDLLPPCDEDEGNEGKSRHSV
jgi:hypothetical protein